MLPTMLLYPDALLRKAVNDYMIPNQDAEIKTWLAYRQAFDDRVREVDFEITCLLGEYYKDLRNRVSINAVREKCQLEHRVLDARIRYGIRSRRKC